MKRLLVLIAAASILPACYCGTYDPYYYDYAYYDPYYYGYDATYVYGTYDPYGVYYDSDSSPQTIDLEAAAAAIASRAGESYRRADCVKATSTGATVNYELDNCDARFFGKNIDGRIAVVLSDEGGQFRFTVTSSNLRVNGDDYVLDFTAAASTSGTQRTVTIDSRSRASEKVDSRLSTGTITWEQGRPCLTINAQGTSSRKDVSITSTVSDFQKCADACPTSGTVTVRGGEGEFSGSFNGSDKLRVVAPNGSDRNFGLQCNY